jgi:thiol-disulfide isomerase/thioredoxin
MGKGARIREQSARERIAMQQAAARRADMRRRGILLGGSIVVVIAVVVALVVAFNLRSNNKPATAAGGVHGTPLPASVSGNITSVPAATLDQIGSGSIPSYQNKTYTGSPIAPISDTPLTSGGKPEMLYIGAEYCPYCAAMRWSMAVALSRFGQFTTPLHGFHSSPTDVAPNTPTLTFYQQGYSSKYLVFTPVENEDINRKPLQSTTSAQQSLWQKYDSSSSGLGYPFVDFGNKAVLKYPLFDPGILKGMTWAQVASAMHDPSSPVAQSINGAANYMTAAICKMTTSNRAPVCSSSAVTKLESGV